MPVALTRPQHIVWAYTGGHIDWYLPAMNELNVLYTNRTAIGGFQTVVASWYWSATEYVTNGAARVQRFTDGTQNISSKNNSMIVRCVRR